MIGRAIHMNDGFWRGNRLVTGKLIDEWFDQNIPGNSKAIDRTVGTNCVVSHKSTDLRPKSYRSPNRVYSLEISELFIAYRLEAFRRTADQSPLGRGFIIASVGYLASPAFMETNMETTMKQRAILIAACTLLMGGCAHAQFTDDDENVETLGAVRQEMRALTEGCNDFPRRSEDQVTCIATCRAASQTPDDSALVQQCRTLQPAPKSPSLSASEMERMAAYCESVRHQIQYSAKLYPADSCASLCRPVNRNAYTEPEQQQACARSYQAVRDMAGD